MRSGPRLPLAYPLSVAAIASLVILYPVLSIYPTFAPQSWDTVVALLSAVTAYSALMTWKRYGPTTRSRFSLAWGLFAAGVVSAFGAQVVTASYELFLGAPQPPPLTLLLYLVAFAFLISGASVYLRFFLKATASRVKVVSAIAGFVLAAAVVDALVGPVMASSVGADGKLLEMAFPLLSLALLFIVALGLVTFMHGKLGRAWAIMAAAMVLGAAGAFVSDVYAAGPLSYAPGSEVLFGSAYALGTLAFYVHRAEL